MLLLEIMAGERIEIGDRSLDVSEVDPDGRAVLSLEGEPIVIMWDRKTLVLPEVVMFVSRRYGNRSSSVRLAVDAPREIKIRRVPRETRPEQDHGEPERRAAGSD